jgi:hypothetical protein
LYTSLMPIGPDLLAPANGWLSSMPNTGWQDAVVAAREGGLWGIEPAAANRTGVTEDDISRLDMQVQRLLARAWVSDKSSIWRQAWLPKRWRAAVVGQRLVYAARRAVRDAVSHARDSALYAATTNRNDHKLSQGYHSAYHNAPAQHCVVAMVAGRCSRSACTTASFSTGLYVPVA